MQETIYSLVNAEIMRLDVDDNHWYYGAKKDESGNLTEEKQFYVGVTTVLDVAGPFPEGLRQYLRATSFEESKERLEVTGTRGTKLHHALDMLMQAEKLQSKDYPTQYEKDAIATFIQWCEFLAPSKFNTETVVSDPRLRIAGTMDFSGFVDEWRLTALLNPTKYLEVDSENHLQLKEKWLDLPADSRRVRIVIDWKFTGRNAWSHKVQVCAYKKMLNMSLPGRKASRAFTWRYSPLHKFHFDFNEALRKNGTPLEYPKEFMWIYNTFLAFSEEFPQPPTIRRYPDEFRLYDKLDKENIGEV